MLGQRYFARISRRTRLRFTRLPILRSHAVIRLDP